MISTQRTENGDECGQSRKCDRSSAQHVVRFRGVTELWLSSAAAASETQTTEKKVPARSLWYSRREYHKFKKLILADFEETVRSYQASCKNQEDNLCSSIRRAYNEIQASRPLEEEQKSDDKLNDEEPDLRPMFHGYDGIVGLERLADMELYCDRRRRYSDLIEAIAHAQADPGMHSEEHLRHVCEQISRPSKLFARYLANAAAESSMERV